MLKYHIQTIEVNSGSALGIAFSNIPQIYDDLLLKVSGRGDPNAANGGVVFLLGFNGSYSNITGRFLAGVGSSVTSGTDTAMYITTSANDYTANTFGNSAVYISNYTSLVAKSLSLDGVGENNATASRQVIMSGLWNPPTQAAISTINVSAVAGTGNILANTSFSLYGIKRGADGRTEVAAGGTITTSGGYTIHTFNSSGTFVANRNLNVEYLVIGGGGGGGAGATDSVSTRGGGGGGAGGYRCSVPGEISGGGAQAESRLSLQAGTNYTVIVGAGGNGMQAGTTNLDGSNGSNSSFANITSIGGGRGGGSRHLASLGGSSGGANGGQLAIGGTSGQGFAGGQGISNGADAGAGAGGGGAAGGGANASGTNPNFQGGNGGVGRASSITGTSITRAGGGGGAPSLSSNPNLGLGGTGGGGNASASVPAPSGTANTGSGGGAQAGDGTGGNGGSGVVIIRYLTPAS